MEHGFSVAYSQEQFFALAENEVKRAQRYGRTLSAIVLGIDDLAGIRQTFGPVWANEALRVLALACDENLRAPDVFGRYGEDDLGVMLPEANEAAGVQLAFRLRNMILQTVLPTVHGPLSVTVSLGVAATVGEVVDLSRLLEHAEQSRQAAVEAGGDCVRGCFVADRRGNLDEALAKLGRRGTDKSAAETGLVTLSQEEINMLLQHQAGSR